MGEIERERENNGKKEDKGSSIIKGDTGNK